MSEAAGSVKVILAADASSYSAALEKAKQQLNQLAGASRSAGHSTVSSTQAASAAIRLMEGDVTNLVRAAERFVAQSQVLSGVLKTAFPVIGAIAIAGVIARGTEAAVKFIETARKMPQALATGFQELATSGQLANDELRRTNDELANQIAKLEGKQQNNLALAIDDARIAADKLAQSLMRDNKQVADLLKTNQIGWLQSLVTGNDSTTAVSGAVNYWNQELANKGHNYNQAVHQYGPESDQAKAASAALDQRRKDAEAAMQMEIDTRTPGPNRAANVTGDQTGNLNIARGYLTMLQQQDDQEQLQSDNKALTNKQQSLAHAKELAGEQRELATQRIRDAQDQLEQIKAEHTVSADEEASYWQRLADSAAKGSDLYKEAMAKANIARAQAVKDYQNQWIDQILDNAKFRDGSSYTASRADLSKDSDETRPASEQGKAAAGWLKNLNQGVTIQKANADALAEQSLQMAVATGQISRLDAAQVQAQLHTQEYTEALQQLENARAAVMSRSDLSELEKKQQTSAIDNQISALNGQRDLQSNQDQQAIESATALGQLREAASQLATRFTDAGAQITDLMTQAVTGFNQTFAQSVTAHAYNGVEYRRNMANALGGQFRQLGSSGVNKGLETVEGSVLSKFGLGPKKKPDGTASNPMYVRVVGSDGGVAGLSDPLGLNIPGVDVAGWAASLAPSGMSGLNSLTAGLPGFAAGGDTPSNMPFVVGENGPEVLQFPVPGHVTPNHRIATGSTTHMPISIDARGATDPAATKAMVYQAIADAAPHIARMTSAAQAKHRASLPPSRSR